MDNGIDREPPVILFMMGVDEWRNEAEWPLPDTQYRPYYLRSSGGANTLHGDGTLSTEPPDDEPPDVYLYNPLRPVPTIGAAVIELTADDLSDIADAMSKITVVGDR